MKLRNITAALFASTVMLGASAAFADTELTVYTAIEAEDLQRYVSLVEAGELTIQTGPVWSFDQLPAAHQAMDENRANGKMVVVVG